MVHMGCPCSLTYLVANISKYYPALANTVKHDQDGHDVMMENCLSRELINLSPGPWLSLTSDLSKS